MTHTYRIKKYGSLKHNKKCRLICRGKNGNILIEFEDGSRMVTVRFGIKRILS